MANDDPMAELEKLKKHIEKTLGKAGNALKNISSGITEVDKAFVKIDGVMSISRMMSNGVTTIEFANKEDQKKHFDSLKKWAE